MADPLHKTERAMAQVESLIRGLKTTESRVFRDQVFALDSDEDLPCLVLLQGPEIDLERSAHDELRISLELYIDIYVAIASRLGTELNKIDREVILALADDQTGQPKIDLDFVEYIRNEGREAPEPNAEYDTPAMMQRLVWTIVYTRDRKDPAN